MSRSYRRLTSLTVERPCLFHRSNGLYCNPCDDYGVVDYDLTIVCQVYPGSQYSYDEPPEPTDVEILDVFMGDQGAGTARFPWLLTDDEIERIEIAVTEE